VSLRSNDGAPASPFFFKILWVIIMAHQSSCRWRHSGRDLLIAWHRYQIPADVARLNICCG
jgi:hypothetical protein